MLQRVLVLSVAATLLLPNLGSLHVTAEPTTTEERAVIPVTEAKGLTIRARVEEVRVAFSVRDRRTVVKEISADQFAVLDDGQPVSKLTSFSQDSSLPLHIGLLMDRSDSMQKGFAAEREAARKFLERLLRPQIDSLFLQDFAVQSSVQHLSAGNLQFITNRVESIRSGGHTALYDALVNASEAMSTSAESEPARRVIILLSDGDDNYSRQSLDDAIEAAQRTDIAIYGITAHTSRWVYQGDIVLERLAAATGGRAFILKNFDEVERVFAQIEEELRTQYWVTFRPARARRCGFHTLEVRPHNSKLRVRAREGYYACDR